ncbi:glutamate-5-semialdehyde dehydrogenase [Coprobacter secundus]|uniref:Gamma-glutamyl phosphate reductase n=1 Tax=Coprobacter secundus subsp. similis TaxID=2751153 RepID=A0A7G1HUR2_9BACT|nr:glutamate-5-semialdehyde dehydrogenase [Coprobacter secundus]BCI63485.1 gamma-glutamyl phosphate reductase [Coprobacter secundus subsp. similis]CCY36319.1 gamma-glutamyl phosphate reductase [Tannerella sp. CAG:118]
MSSITGILKAVKNASRKLNLLDVTTINSILMSVADETEKEISYLLNENKRDLEVMDKSNPKYDRLMLTSARISEIASDMRKVAALPSPLGHILNETIRPNGMKICKISVPFGVIGIIYEARPNVTFDVFSLCLKSGNACVLKGGSEAQYSNKAILNVINNVLTKFGIDLNTTVLLSNEREITSELLTAVDYVDLVIPRGSKNLIEFVRNNSLVPVIETGAGICHTYFDKYGDVKKGSNIINNAKTRRVSVCNALDCLLIDSERLNDLPALCSPLSNRHVIIYADDEAYKVLQNQYPMELLQLANEKSFGTEFLDYKMAIKTVHNMDEALEHINHYSSKHSECIISEDKSRQQRFIKEVDAACVYSNVSTAFTDGGQFGFGAEIGISTQKLHARGPMALPELTTYKYVIWGDGQTRQN